MSAVEGSQLFELAKGGDFQAFAKFLTWLEKVDSKQAFQLTELFEPQQTAFRLGITGPPGAGKSTLVARLIQHLRQAQLKVGVLAVDPSSPFTRGAILGDRIRYSDHSLDPGVFIRSLGTRGSLGGLSSSAFLMARAFDVCGFDILLIETVGVGQTELDVLHVADLVCVVLVPESGDSVQAMKAGLMEIADIFVVNKSDRPGADSLAREIEASVHDGSSQKNVQVLKIVATEDQGTPALLKLVLDEKQKAIHLPRRLRPERLREEAKSLLRREWESEILPTLAGVQTVKDFTALFK